MFIILPIFLERAVKTIFTNKSPFAAWDVYFSVLSGTTLSTNTHVPSSVITTRRSIILN